jgi:GT2 family glycosyltransferase
MPGTVFPMLPGCAVVIATHNRAAALRKTLEELYELPERPPIVVADNASTDATEAACKPFGSRVQLLKLRRNMGAAARTIGAREAGTPFVAFCDDDCAWGAGSLQRAVERLEAHERVALINARVLVGDEGKPDPACQEMRAAAGVPSSAVPIVYFMAGACVMRTKAFLEAGGYHVRYFIGAEETLLAIDLAAHGWQLWYCDDVIVHHRPSSINRDPDRRRRLVLRNRLWTVMLRRSAACALRVIAEYVRLARSDNIVRAALKEAIAGLPWVIRERRSIPRELELRMRAFDRLLAP